jgi:hypothetical protein
MQDGATGKHARGDFVELDGLPAVVVGLAGEPGVPEEHLALWFGTPQVTRISKGGSGHVAPEVWTVPEDLVRAGAPPIWNH